MEDRPITFTITQLHTGNCMIYTKDGRVKKSESEIIVSKNMLMSMLIVITGVFNKQGYAVLFEVD